MDIILRDVSRKRITTSPAGRGWKPRPEVVVNSEYVKKLLEENRLTERDEILFKYLDTLPVLSSRQIHRLLWYDSTTSNMHRRLRQLYDYHLLDRVRMIDKAEGITYTLGKAARIWLHGEARGGSAPVVNVKTLRHDLTVSEILVLLTEEIRIGNPKHTVSLQWYGEHQIRVIDRDRVLVEPDALGEMHIGRTPSTMFYLELDMGTERKAALERKLNRYYQAARAKRLKHKGLNIYDVFFITPTEARAKNVASIIADYRPKPARSETPPITWIIGNLDSMKRHGFYRKNRWVAVLRNEIVHRGALAAPWMRG
jgi:hypothetical protein